DVASSVEGVDRRLNSLHRSKLNELHSRGGLALRLWGLDCEIKRHAELSEMEEHEGKTAIEISEMVIKERWDLKQRKKLYNEVHHREYDGGDL
ncbi:hypothetical protein THAOC_01519, partial [Thalassiosira oceanica]